MDSVDSKEQYGEPRRRSTRQKKVVDVRPRIARKRRTEVKKDLLPAAVNGSKEQESATTEEETGSPNKIRKLQMAGDAGDGDGYGHGEKIGKMEVVEYADQDQDMSSEDESESCDLKKKHLIKEESLIRDADLGKQEMEASTTLLNRRITHQQLPGLSKPMGYQNASSQTSLKEPSRESPASVRNRQLENRHDVLTARSSIREYRKKMEEKGVCSAELKGWNRYPHSIGHTTTTHQINNLPTKKQQPQHRKTELKKPVIRKARSTSYSKGSGWHLCRVFQWAVGLLVLLGLGLVGYKHLPPSTAEHQDKIVSSQTLEAQLTELKVIFPSQRLEFWKRTEVHLKRHLNLAQPTEPVSMILTSGRGAEKTLACLAQRLAVAFSTALNASVLDIDGASKTAQDPDQVKLDIDVALKEAFEGGKRSAVIHRFEELPPGATLIFYRYCDHENAVFKNVFLMFTVLLPGKELPSDVSLSAVEEKVHEYVNNKFISSDSTASFNQMDVDKLSGLWSRISHVILPVAAEHTVEQQGCDR